MKKGGTLARIGDQDARADLAREAEPPPQPLGRIVAPEVDMAGHRKARQAGLAEVPAGFGRGSTGEMRHDESQAAQSHQDGEIIDEGSVGDGSKARVSDSTLSAIDASVVGVVVPANAL